jgi:chromosome segregation ATPase
MPMKRFLVLLSAAATLGTVACSQPEVVVEARLPQQGADAGSVPLAELPIRLLPYDRDAIFDSLEAAAREPEPTIPPDILEAQQQVQQAQTEWRDAEERWNTVRVSLRTIADRLQQMGSQGLRGTPQYRQMFEQFGRLEAEERQVNQRNQQAFARFDELQRSTLTRADSIRAVQEAWAERAFADFPSIVEARLRDMREEEIADTTDANGIAVIRAPKGQWWVYARYTLPYEELYWNLPVEVTGDSAQIELTVETAERRPVM